MQENEIISKIKLFRYSEKSIGVSGLNTREQRLYFRENIKPQIKGCRFQPSGWFRDLFLFPLSSITEAIIAIALANIDVEIDLFPENTQKQTRTLTKEEILAYLAK